MALKQISFRTFGLLSLVALSTLLLIAGGFYWLYNLIPSDKAMRGCMTTKMYHVTLCPGSSSYVPLSQISTYLQKSAVLTEDSSFWDHQGFDLQEMQNSLKANLAKGKFARGGSTITQQLAKNLFLTKDKTLMRKFLEAILTVRLEKALTKKQILERYLNVVQFGKDIFGIKAASEFYFHKPAFELDLVESTFLTFLLPSPEVYSKSFYKKKLTPFASQRLHTIIDRLYQYKRISESEYLSAKAELETFLGGSDVRVIDPTIDQIQEDDPAVEEQIEEDL